MVLRRMSPKGERLTRSGELVGRGELVVVLEQVPVAAGEDVDAALCGPGQLTRHNVLQDDEAVPVEVPLLIECEFRWMHGGSLSRVRHTVYDLFDRHDVALKA